LRDALPRIRAAGAELVVVGNGTLEQARAFAREFAPDITVLTDPERRTYRVVGARRSPLSILDPRTLINAWRARTQGFTQKEVLGDGLQLGGVFVVRPDGSVPFHHLSAVPGDHPDPERVLSALARSQ